MTPEEMETALLRQSRDIEALRKSLVESIVMSKKHEQLANSVFETLRGRLDQIIDRIETLETNDLGD